MYKINTITPAIIKVDNSDVILSAKECYPMKDLNSYVDRCIIDEYATKSLVDGYSLDIDDLPKHEISNFLDKLMDSDTSIKDDILYYMQELINKRLHAVEFDEAYDMRRERAA